MESTKEERDIEQRAADYADSKDRILTSYHTGLKEGYTQGFQDCRSIDLEELEMLTESAEKQNAKYEAELEALRKSQASLLEVAENLSHRLASSNRLFNGMPDYVDASVHNNKKALETFETWKEQQNKQQ